jgi:metal-responsive CopG/Arc/MetJ family transcriptional regulator
VKTAISIPDPIFEAAEELASKLGVSRSELYSTAVAGYVSAHQSREVTERLDVLYSQESSALDDALLRAQLVSLQDEGW